MDYYKALTELMGKYPELTLNNDGYEELMPEVKERNKDAIAEVEAVLKKCVHAFVRFQNFKPRKDGSFDVRCQTAWSASFIGVSYLPLENFKPDHPSWSDKEKD